MTNQLITPPVVEPVTLNQAKSHLRVTANDEDQLINGMIGSARQQAETYLRRSILTQTRELYKNCFNGIIELDFPPVQSVVSIKYKDVSEVQQTLATSEYVFHPQNEPGLIELATGKTWPATSAQLNAVTVQYIAGYKQPDEVPAPIVSAILLILGDLYRNRENASPEQNYELPFAANCLLDPYRMMN